MMREFVTGAIVSQKRLSRKYSWTQYDDRSKLDRETQRILLPHDGYGYDARRWRFRYRVNVYRKAPLRALTGPMGRVTCQH